MNRKQSEIVEACEKLVEQSKLVEIDYDTDNPSFQEIEAFLENKYGVKNLYEPCCKCGEMIHTWQEEYARVDYKSDWYYIHAECVKPHTAFQWLQETVRIVLEKKGEDGK